MQRTVNLVIGLAVLVGVSLVLFGSIGGRSQSSGRPTPSGSSRSGLPQIDVATSIVGPTASEPPPFPSTAAFPPPGTSPRLAANLADPSRLVEARWERARRRILQVFGGSLSAEQEAAVRAAVATWVGMQVNAVAAYHGGYIDAHMLGVHSGWNRNVYMLGLQDALGNADFQRYAGAGAELDEIAPGL